MEGPAKVPGKKACGIDFGTYEIAVAVVNSDDPNGVTLVSNYLANETTPGVVKMYNGMRTYAEEALGSATMCPQNVISHIPLVLEYSDCIEKLTEDYPDLCFVAKKAENGEIVFELKDYAVPEVSLTHVMSMLLRYIFGFHHKEVPRECQAHRRLRPAGSVSRRRASGGRCGAAGRFRGRQGRHDGPGAGVQVGPRRRRHP